jgi:hypothetical protein
MSIAFSQCATISFYLFDKKRNESFKIEREVQLGEPIDWDKLIEEEEIKYAMNERYLDGIDGRQTRIQSKNNNL